MYDLLTDDLIGVRVSEGERRVNLPGLFALLARNSVDAYTGLRAHQEDPWHVFLVQLAASILARFPASPLPGDPGYWRDGLLDLADGRASAWSLLVEDVTLPAFLQHPWSSWEAEAQDYGARRRSGGWIWQPKARTPDELDVLLTSKNHDIKMSRVGPDAIEAWLYALLVYQTTSGYLGQGNYGIIRMNGGHGSRPIVSWCTSLHPARRFQEELAVLTRMREGVMAAYGYRSRGVVLTWLAPWNRSSHQYMLQELEPWFIEAARPVRLRQESDGALAALGATSKARQIGPKDPGNGDVGDPWIPVNLGNEKKGRAALTLTGQGFTPRRLTELIFEKGFELTPLQKPRAGSEPGWFVASALARAEGKTEGYHRITLPVPAKACLALFRPADRGRLAELAEKLLQDADIAGDALRAALAAFAEGGPDTDKASQSAVQQWVRRLESSFAARWKQRYFDCLWRGADEDHEAIQSHWRHELVSEAQSILERARAILPIPSNRTYRAAVRAADAFSGRLRRKGFLISEDSSKQEQESAL